ncbi:hypothetical protein [Coleofasciculus sp. FACHB-SPT36]|uniref:hypothetical protein n=1 Tax=Cyanophyceae TaxID=3028117 RepID=UPI00168AB491|nr:hypothetical protein [Coleofasciculus sp. FACHB-SPT36]MBD2541233.1 hypothetical protein [Coleofasciculus sp. FACHB-SPT36]
MHQRYRRRKSAIAPISLFSTKPEVRSSLAGGSSIVLVRLLLERLAALRNPKAIAFAIQGIFSTKTE